MYERNVSELLTLVQSISDTFTKSGILNKCGLCIQFTLHGKNLIPVKLIKV